MSILKTILSLFKPAKPREGSTFGEKNNSNLEESASLSNHTNHCVKNELTAEIIDNTPDDNLIYVVFNNIIKKFPKDYKKEYQTVLSLSKSSQAIYLTWQWSAEVKNGGFNQYYFNTKGQFASLIPDTLRLIGAVQFAELAEKANQIFKIKIKKITEHWDGTLEGFSESYEDNPLNSLDLEFYAMDENDDLEKLQTSFIRENKAEFVDK